MNVCFRKTRYLLQQPEIAGPPYQVRLLHCKCDIEDMENGMEFHLQIKTMRFINQYGVRFKYRARLDTLRAKSGSEINIRLCCFHTFRMSVHLSIYRLKMHHNGCIVEGGEDLLGVWTKARQNISPRTSPGLCITHK